MFLNLLKMDFIRCINIKKIVAIMLIFVFLLFLGNDEFVRNPAGVLPWGEYYGGVGIIEYIEAQMHTDTFKVVFVILLCSLYTGSYSKEKSNGYIRMLLGRVDVVSYIQSKLIANTVIMIAVYTGALFLFVLIMLPHAPLMPAECESYHRYKDIMMAHPVGYVFMLGLMFGMVSAAFSSFGLLVSLFQPNAFVSIGLPGLIFYLMVSFVAFYSPFSVFGIVGMECSLSIWVNCPPWVDYLWGIFLSFVTICICGCLCCFSLSRRMKNGDI